MEGITILFDTDSGNNRKLINMTEFSRAYTEEYRAALLVYLHAVDALTQVHLKERGMPNH